MVGTIGPAPGANTLQRVSRWFAEFGLAAVDDQRRLFTGALPTDAGDVATLRELGIEVIVNLCEDREYPADARETVERSLNEAGIEECRVPFTDYGSLESARVDDAVDQVLGQLEAGRRVYLHCRAGWQRSGAVAAGALALRDGVSLEAALTDIQQRRPEAVPLQHQWEDLMAWYRGRMDHSSKPD